MVSGAVHTLADGRSRDAKNNVAESIPLEADYGSAHCLPERERERAPPAISHLKLHALGLCEPVSIQIRHRLREGKRIGTEQIERLVRREGNNVAVNAQRSRNFAVGSFERDARARDARFVDGLAERCRNSDIAFDIGVAVPGSERDDGGRDVIVTGAANAAVAPFIVARGSGRTPPEPEPERPPVFVVPPEAPPEPELPPVSPLSPPSPASFAGGHVREASQPRNLSPQPTGNAQTAARIPTRP